MTIKVLEKLEERCVPALNETYERYVFFKREQLSNESFDSYITAMMKEGGKGGSRSRSRKIKRSFHNSRKNKQAFHASRKKGERVSLNKSCIPLHFEKLRPITF